MAEYDMYLKIDGVEGDSKAKGHTSEIDIREWCWHEKNEPIVQGNGFGAGRVDIGAVQFRKMIDKSSVELMKKCASGEHIEKIVLSCRRSTGGAEPEDFLNITFSNVYIREYYLGSKPRDSIVRDWPSSLTDASSAVSLPLDEFSVVFGKMEWDFKPPADKNKLGASIKGGYDRFERTVS